MNRRICLALVIGVLLLGCDRTFAEVQRVGMWDRFEESITNGHEYADPFRDVSLDVVWTRPDGRETKFWGFHDGGQTWRIRFMPDQLGTWTYRAAFSDTAKAVTGAFECVASELPGMVTVYEPNPIWFGFRGGDPLLLRSLHVGDRFFAGNWESAERSAFLDWAQSQGYNTLSIASHYLNRSVASRGAGWDTPRLWPLNPAAYAEMEALLDDLSRRRMIVFPFGGFFGKSSNFPRRPADQELYVRYTLARIGCYWNLLLNVAGPEPNLKRDTYLSESDVNRLGRMIRHLDVYGHPLTVHNRSGKDPYRDSDWSTFGTLQGPKTLDRQRLAHGVRASHHPTKPLYAQETLWMGNKHHPEYSMDDVRKNAWVLLLSGAMINFGDMDGNSSSGFSGSMNLSQRCQSCHDEIHKVWDTFEGFPFEQLTPHPDLVDGGWCLADPGSRYLIYLDSPRTVEVEIPPGGYSVQWINPRAPGQRLGADTMTSVHTLTPPGDGDWLLWITRTPHQASP